ncbi:MAG: hypothetical protein LBO72_07025 [Helicobacteraceae bacterium]|nr:hypothetical protein [Helicobacteraceae bacterium]
MAARGLFSAVLEANAAVLGAGSEASKANLALFCAFVIFSPTSAIADMDKQNLRLFSR